MGSPAQKSEWAPANGAGELIAAIGITEPAAGSDMQWNKDYGAAERNELGGIMCGILAVFTPTRSDPSIANCVLKRSPMAKKLRHRGPIGAAPIATMSHLLHERLSIVDVEHGAQPLIDGRTNVLSVNGRNFTITRTSPDVEKFSVNSRPLPIAGPALSL